MLLFTRSRLRLRAQEIGEVCREGKNARWKLGFLFINKKLCDSRKINHPTREIQVKFNLKNRYRTHCFAFRPISVFRVKFNVEFLRHVINFPTQLQTCCFKMQLW